MVSFGEVVLASETESSSDSSDSLWSEILQLYSRPLAPQPSLHVVAKSKCFPNKSQSRCRELKIRLEIIQWLSPKPVRSSRWLMQSGTRSAEHFLHRALLSRFLRREYGIVGNLAQLDQLVLSKAFLVVLQSLRSKDRLVVQLVLWFLVNDDSAWESPVPFAQPLQQFFSSLTPTLLRLCALYLGVGRGVLVQGRSKCSLAQSAGGHKARASRCRHDCPTKLVRVIIPTLPCQILAVQYCSISIWYVNPLHKVS